MPAHVNETTDPVDNLVAVRVARRGLILSISSVPVPGKGAQSLRLETVAAVALAYELSGAGVGFVGTPASHSLTASVPDGSVGMASGTADLHRDLGGAIMQSLFGALLATGYAATFTATIASAPNTHQISTSMQNELPKSFSSAADAAQQYPQ